MKEIGKLEAVLWSIALPGFSQILRGDLFKGFLFIFLEFVVNVSAHFNKAIMLSFLWEIEQAVNIVNYQWLMFYPCLYMFAMWDAYRSAMPADEKYSFLPFTFGAYFVTVGLMLSPRLKLFGILFGPVFLPMMFLLPGLTLGFIFKTLLLYLQRKKEGAH